MKTHSKNLTLICITSMGCYSVLAYAAESNQNMPSLAVITVNAQPSSVLSSTTGLKIDLKDTPQSISVISQQQIKNLGLNTLQGAMKYTSGINILKDSGRIRFQSRGFYIDQIEEDGLSSTLPGASSNPFRSATSTSDLEIYDHIEVLRGASGLTQANSEPGGTINLVRKKPTEEFQANGKVSYGSWNQVRSSADVSGAVNEQGSVRTRVVAVAGQADSFKKTVDENNQTIYGVIDVDVGTQTLLRLGTLYQQTQTKPDIFGLPLGAKGRALDLPIDTYLGANWSKDDFKKTNLFAEVEHKFNEDWIWNSKINSTRSDGLQKFAALGNGSTSYAGVPITNVLSLNNMQNYDTHGDELAVVSNLSGQFDVWQRPQQVFIRLSYNLEKQNTYWKRVLDSTPYNIYSFNSGLIAQPNWQNSATLMNDVRYKNKIEQQAVALGGRFNIFDRLHVLAGGRYTDFKSGGDYQYFTYDHKPDHEYKKNAEITKEKFIPYLGLTYDITPQITAYTSHTEIFKPQSSLNKEGKVLDPILGTNQELGIKGSFYDQRLNLAAALFQVEQKNRPIQVLGTRFFDPEGKVRSRGVDLEVSGEILPQWKLFAGYTFNKSKYLKTETKTNLSGANFSQHSPEHLLKFYTDYSFSGRLENLSIGVGAIAQSNTESLYGIKQGGYTFYQANVRYQFNPQLALNLSGENLTNKLYYENQRTRTNGMNNFYGTPRNYLLSLEWNF